MFARCFAHTKCWVSTQCALQDTEIQTKHGLEPACGAAESHVAKRAGGGTNKLCSDSSLPVTVCWFQQLMAHTCMQKPWRRAALRMASPMSQPKPTSQAVVLTINTICSPLPEVWLYSCAEELCSASVAMLGLQHPSERWGFCSWMLYHREGPAENPVGGWELRFYIIQKLYP